MAKIKASTIVLSLAAIAIWCVVGYRVYRWVSPKDAPAGASAPKPRRTDTRQPDTLLLDYRDPFFQSPARETRAAGRGTAPKPAEEQPLPALAYKGLIRDGRGMVKAMVSFEGRVEGYPVGSVVGGARIKGIKADCITVEWQGKEHTVKAR